MCAKKYHVTPLYDIKANLMKYFLTEILTTLSNCTQIHRTGFKDYRLMASQIIAGWHGDLDWIVNNHDDDYDDYGDYHCAR